MWWTGQKERNDLVFLWELKCPEILTKQIRGITLILCIQVEFITCFYEKRILNIHKFCNQSFDEKLPEAPWCKNGEGGYVFRGFWRWYIVCTDTLVISNFHQNVKQLNEVPEKIRQNRYIRWLKEILPFKTQKMIQNPNEASASSEVKKTVNLSMDHRMTDLEGPKPDMDPNRK